MDGCGAASRARKSSGLSAEAEAVGAAGGSCSTSPASIEAFNRVAVACLALAARAVAAVHHQRYFPQAIADLPAGAAAFRGEEGWVVCVVRAGGCAGRPGRVIGTAGAV